MDWVMVVIYYGLCDLFHVSLLSSFLPLSPPACSCSLSLVCDPWDRSSWRPQRQPKVGLSTLLVPQGAWEPCLRWRDTHLSPLRHASKLLQWHNAPLSSQENPLTLVEVRAGHDGRHEGARDSEAAGERGRVAGAVLPRECSLQASRSTTTKLWPKVW